MDWTEHEVTCLECCTEWIVIHNGKTWDDITCPTCGCHRISKIKDVETGKVTQIVQDD